MEGIEYKDQQLIGSLNAAIRDGKIDIREASTRIELLCEHSDPDLLKSFLIDE